MAQDALRALRFLQLWTVFKYRNCLDFNYFLWENSSPLWRVQYKVTVVIGKQESLQTTWTKITLEHYRLLCGRMGTRTWISPPYRLKKRTFSLRSAANSSGPALSYRPRVQTRQTSSCADPLGKDGGTMQNSPRRFTEPWKSGSDLWLGLSTARPSSSVGKPHPPNCHQFVLCSCSKCVAPTAGTGIHVYIPLLSVCIPSDVYNSR